MLPKLILTFCLLSSIVSSQLTKSQQEHLRQIADNELLKGDSLEGLAQAGHVLSMLS
jgi:hypothetical protein